MQNNDIIIITIIIIIIIIITIKNEFIYKNIYIIYTKLNNTKKQ